MEKISKKKFHLKIDKNYRKFDEKIILEIIAK